MNKIILSIFIIVFIAISFNVTNIVAQEDRYSSECGIGLLMTPEEYLQKVGETWNFDLKSMTPFVYDTYVCVYKVYNQEKTTGLNLDEIQSKADEKLKELGNAMIRGND